jgi:hypothetical protein
MDRTKTVLGIILMGIFMCSLFTVQALPLLAPFGVAAEYGMLLVFLGALLTGFLLGMLTPSVAKGVFAGFASIVLGLILAGCVLALPSLLGIAGQLGLVSTLALERAVLFAVILTPISAVGIFIGCLV